MSRTAPAEPVASPAVPRASERLAVVLGRGLHAPWTEGGRVINRNFALAAGSRRRVQVLSLTNERFRADALSPAAADLATRHVLMKTGYSLLGVYAGLPLLLRQVGAIRRQRKIDVVHLFGVPLSLAPLVRTSRTRVIAHFHTVPIPWRDQLLVKASIRLFGRWVDAYAITSEVLRDTLQRWGVPADKVLVLPSAIDTSTFRRGSRAQAREALGLDPDEGLVLYIGRLTSNRFPADLIAAGLQDAAKLTHRGVRFVALSPFETLDGSENSAAYLASCTRLARERLDRLGNLTTDVRQVDLSDQDKVNWFQAADVVVLPFVASEAVEPPLTLLEAMACGATVVVSQAANRSSLVRSAETGFVFHNADDFARHVAQAVDSNGGHDRIAERARQVVEERHGFDAVAAAAAEAWRRVEVGQRLGRWSW